MVPDGSPPVGPASEAPTPGSSAVGGAEAAAGERADRLRVGVPGRPAWAYEVWVGAGLLAEMGALVRERCPAYRYAVITDSQVAPRYGPAAVAALADAAPGGADLLVVPAGEWNKTRESWARLCDRMLAAGYGRDAAVVALGGGVVGDLAGFVAATFLRGIPWVQVPTTLLAMLDSSIGGKTGVDTPAGKNLVGAFHPPSLVVVDPETLRTLPAHQMAAGLAEAVKHGAIADAAYFERVAREADAYFRQEPDALRGMIRRSLEIKAAVVEADEREAGLRKILNFGHTVAHALEAALGYELLHGEAVAIGMVAEARLGEAIGVTRPGTADRVARALEAVRCPVEIPSGLDPETFVRALAVDKKRRAGVVEYTLLAEVGRAAPRGEGGPEGGAGWTHPVPEEVAARVLFGGG
jgi:3-dehydroquinate synthase